MKSFGQSICVSFSPGTPVTDLTLGLCPTWARKDGFMDAPSSPTQAEVLVSKKIIHTISWVLHLFVGYVSF